MPNPLVFVVYDSIHHSIFEGQILAPLLKKLALNLYSTVHIVSFEETLSPAVFEARKKIAECDPRITLTLIKRPRFTFAFLLRYQAQQLRTILAIILEPYELYARGPLAGLIARQSITSQCATFTVQARGLLAEEHNYTHRFARGLKRYAHILRKQQLWQVEKECYSRPLQKAHLFFIEAVSPALKGYLESEYQTPSDLFVTPQFDHPEPVSKESKLIYRTQIRKALNISNAAIVYVYNGSLKPWQCPEETIAVFEKIRKQNDKAFYLALTQETETMRTLLMNAQIPEAMFRVLHVTQSEVTHYLCAADFGLLFREPHPLNWVSRPTKLLEYQAAGLQILHNNTIALLSEK